MHRKLALVLATAVISLGAWLFMGLSVVHAQSVQSGDNLSVPSSKSIDGSYFAGGRSIDIGGTVNGDVICATQTLTVSGTVHGDILCAAQSITITGHVDGNVRLAGQSINLAGSISRSASVIGQSLSVGSGGSIGQDLSYAGTSLTSDGKIGRDLVTTVQSASVSGTVGRNVTATTNNLAFENGANVAGTVHYTSFNKASVASGAHVGSLQQSQAAKQQTSRSIGGFLLFVLWLILTALFCSLILVLVMPLFFWTTSEETVARPGWTILAGFLTSIILPALIFLAFATVIGIPLGFLLLFAYIILFLLSFPVAAFYLGRLLFESWMHRNLNAVALMILGAIALLILLAIPFLDIIVWFLMIWISFGSMVRAFRQRLVRPDYRKPLPVPVAATSRTARRR